MLKQILEFLSDQIHDHWVKLLMALAFAAVGWYFGKRRAKAQWKKKEFLNRLHVSLNILQPGQPLLIRTIIEKSCEEIFLNSVAVEAVNAAARKTTGKNPLLPLKKEDYWYYLNSVLNEISEKFAVGEIRRDLGLPTTTGRYLICLTCEQAEEMRQRKLRAMVIQKKTLLALPAEPPPLEQPWHSRRWETLKFLAAEYQKNPHQFLEMEISL